MSINSFKSQKTITVSGKDYEIFSLKAASENGLGDVSKLPKSLKVLTENLLRKEDGETIEKNDIDVEDVMKELENRRK